MSFVWLEKYIRSTPDFPKEGVIFRWYGSLFRDPLAVKKVLNAFYERYKKMKVDAVLGLESRGFIFGALLAYKLELPFLLMRKKGKLPPPTLSVEFDHEYSHEAFEIEEGILKEGENILVIDDIMATGASFEAAAILIERANAEIVEFGCLIELERLKGRELLKRPVFSLYKINHQA
ncbi:MAG: adenine phosphoribosyltransferase [Simkaniaceae bacterium]